MENAQGTPERQARYADSIEAAAGTLGRSAAFLQRVKAMGCPAFRGSRVYLDELEAYVLENNLETLEAEIEAADAVDVEIRRERLRKIRFENDVAEGRYIARAEIATMMLELASDLNATLQRKLEDEGPDRLTMRERSEVLKVTREIRDEICQQLSRSKLSKM